MDERDEHKAILEAELDDDLAAIAIYRAIAKIARSEGRRLSVVVAEDLCDRLERATEFQDLLSALIEAESEARNELARLRLQGITDGLQWDNWQSKQERWATVIARAQGRRSI